MKIMKLAAAVLAAVMAMGAAPVVDADDGWEWKNIGCMGDLDGDRELTQKEVADRIGISQSYISRLEKKIIKQIRERLEALC